MLSSTIEGLDAVRQLLDSAASAISAINGAYAVVGTNLPYARMVHDGTRPHQIVARNKRALAWPGGAHPVRAVNHPGYRGNPFLTDALKDKTPAVQQRLLAALNAILAQQAGGGAMAEALYAAALEVQAGAMQRVNVRTGTLRRSITVQVYGRL